MHCPLIIPPFKRIRAPFSNASFQVGPGDCLELQMSSRQQSSVPLEKNVLVGGQLYPTRDPPASQNPPSPGITPPPQKKKQFQGFPNPELAHITGWFYSDLFLPHTSNQAFKKTGLCFLKRTDFFAGGNWKLGGGIALSMDFSCRNYLVSSASHWKISSVLSDFLEMYNCLNFSMRNMHLWWSD